LDIASKAFHWLYFTAILLDLLLKKSHKTSYCFAHSIKKPAVTGRFK
jgi:hypothetical protein